MCDEEVLRGDLAKYDWLHLHHEDFTGQYGKFYAAYRHTDWYQAEQRDAEARAPHARLHEGVGREEGGGGEDPGVRDERRLPVRHVLGDRHVRHRARRRRRRHRARRSSITTALTPGYQDKLDYERCFAFTDFRLDPEPARLRVLGHRHQRLRIRARARADYFTLFEFSAKNDPVPTMLTQNHVELREGVPRADDGFQKALVKKSVVILGEDAGTTR